MTHNFPPLQQTRPLATVKPERIDIPSYHAQQAQAPSAPPPPGYGGVPAKNSKPVTQAETDENIESLPDFPSIKGVFGWTTIDQVNIPYILRHEEQFVSVRIVEMKLLSRYPNSYPDDLGKHAPLTSYFITTNEAKLLNEINLTHCGGEYGKKEFNTKDLIVLLSDFVEFFKLVKKTFPDGVNGITDQSSTSSHGWMQIKNTVTPYVKRKDGKYVPLSVMQHAAGLVKQGVTGVSISPPEKDMLNKACKSAGVNFQFSENTKLIRIDQIQADGAHSFRELPPNDPLKHAHYMELPTNSAQPSQEKVSSQKITLALQSQKQAPLSHPYQFQQRLPFDQLSSGGRPPVPSQAQNDILNQNRMNKPPPRYPYPPVFDMRFPPMYGAGRFPPYFPQSNGLPSGPPLPQGYPNVSALNTGPHLNPLAQYYMDSKSPASTNLSRAPPQSQVMNQITSNYDSNKRSPGAQSATPSPRSRHPSGSRPPSASRPPSETPLSPTSFALPPFPNGQFPTQTTPPSTQISQQFHFPGGQTMAQLQGMIRGLQPHAGTKGSAPSISNSSLMNTQVVHQNFQRGNQGQTVNGHINSIERQNLPIKNHTTDSQSLKTTASNRANKDINENSGNQTVGPVPVGLNIPQPKPPDISNSGNGPPPLLRMANPTAAASDKKDLAATPMTVVSVTSDSALVATKELPVPKTVSAVSAPTITSSYADSIKGAWLNNKSISCLHLDKPGRKGRFCLVEAVCKLYFNGYSVLEFLFALEKVLNVSLMICNDEEEKAFIQYYSLPVEVLKCNKMIEFDDLKKFFPQLSYMFPDKNAPDISLALDSTDGETNILEDNNNFGKLLTNGLMSADDLEASALPITVNQTESRQGDKRRSSSPTDQVSKQAKLDKDSEENIDDDAVIILD